MAENDRHARRRQERIRVIAIAVLICVAAVLLAVYGIRAVRKHLAEDELASLAEQTWSVAEDTESSEEADVPSEDSGEQEEPQTDPIEKLREMGVPIPEKEVDIAALQEETNADIYAWIYIPDSNIDYPVLQHPTDNSHYLNYNLDGSKGYPGCIYTENYNTKDFSDPNTVMYGHNMKNGSMFANLHKFEDSEYFEEHPYVYVYTEKGLLVYEVFAAYVSSNEHILYNHDFTNAREYGSYLDGIFETRNMNANIREDVTVTEENRILTLSTCIANRPENRYLVQGVLLNEG